jgi:hypothetical protein
MNNEKHIEVKSDFLICSHFSNRITNMYLLKLEINKINMPILKQNACSQIGSPVKNYKSIINIV